MISLVSILKTSQMTCTVPHGPTRIGPRRHWKAAQTLRSMKIIRMAITVYISSRQPPTITHSMKTASPRGISEVSSPWTQLVIIEKSNIAIQFFAITDYGTTVRNANFAAQRHQVPPRGRGLGWGQTCKRGRAGENAIRQRDMMHHGHRVSFICQYPEPRNPACRRWRSGRRSSSPGRWSPGKRRAADPSSGTSCGRGTCRPGSR